MREEFVSDYVFPMLRANALYEGLYLLGTSIARLIAKRQIEIAREVRRGSHGQQAKAMIRLGLNWAIMHFSLISR